MKLKGSASRWCHVSICQKECCCWYQSGASLSLSLLKSDLSRGDTVWLVQMSRPLQELISSKDRCLAQFLQKLHWKSGVAGQNIAGLDPLTNVPKSPLALRRTCGGWRIREPAYTCSRRIVTDGSMRSPVTLGRDGSPTQSSVTLASDRNLTQGSVTLAQDRSSTQSSVTWSRNMIKRRSYVTLFRKNTGRRSYVTLFRKKTGRRSYDTLFHKNITNENIIFISRQT